MKSLEAMNEEAMKSSETMNKVAMKSWGRGEIDAEISRVAMGLKFVGKV